MRDGVGILKYASGLIEYYEGEFKEDKKTGDGTEK
jgi:hypothetical protein